MTKLAVIGAEHPRDESQPEVEAPLEPDLRFLPLELVAKLDVEDVRPIVHYLAKRLGQAVGDRVMTFELREGYLRSSGFNQGRVRNEQLEAMGRREPP